MSLALETTKTVAGVAGTATAVTYTLVGDEIGTSDAYKVLAQGQLANSAATIYTVPAATSTLVKEILLANATGSPVTGIKLFIGGLAAANQITGSFTIPANGTAIVDDAGLSVWDAAGALQSNYPTRTFTAGTGMTGGGDFSADRTFNVIANADASVVVNADDIQVGVLASDAQHGNRGGAGIHSAATTSTAGFMAAADKTTTNFYDSGAVTTATSGAINTTDTVVTPSFQIAGGTLVAQSTFKITLFGTCTSSAANVSTFTVRLGAAGNNTDTSLGTLTCTAATSGTTIGFVTDFIVTARSVGVSGSVIMSGVLNNTGITGISSNASPVISVGAATTINTTGALFLSITYKSAVSTTTSTFQIASIEPINQ